MHFKSHAVNWEREAPRMDEKTKNQMEKEVLCRIFGLFVVFFTPPTRRRGATERSKNAKKPTSANARWGLQRNEPRWDDNMKWAKKKERESISFVNAHKNSSNKYLKIKLKVQSLIRIKWSKLTKRAWRLRAKSRKRWARESDEEARNAVMCRCFDVVRLTEKIWQWTCLLVSAGAKNMNTTNQPCEREAPFWKVNRKCISIFIGTSCCLSSFRWCQLWCLGTENRARWGPQP